MPLQYDHYDVLVIGGGFYGCAISLELNQKHKRVVLVEKEADLMQRASFVNQARIHQGYHYPRSILTAHRSRINFDRFVAEYKDCVYSDFEQYYAIGKISSKVNAEQFRRFCARVGMPLSSPPKEVKSLFSTDLIEEVFQVQEYAFDAEILKQIMQREISQHDVDMSLNCRVNRVSSLGKLIKIEMETADGDMEITADYVFNCTYAQINQVMAKSSLSMIPLKHEYTEMALVEMPPDLEHMGFTIMDGPFFSIMPFPARQLHSLSHVRYTPHHYWQDRNDEPYMEAHEYFSKTNAESYYVHMLKDAQRYIPVLKDCHYKDSLWEIKTVLPQSEVDDSRPILFRQSEQLPNFISIMGGKIDNVFDIREKLKNFIIQ